MRESEWQLISRQIEKAIPKMTIGEMEMLRQQLLAAIDEVKIKQTQGFHKPR